MRSAAAQALALPMSAAVDPPVRRPAGSLRRWPPAGAVVQQQFDGGELVAGQRPGLVAGDERTAAEPFHRRQLAHDCAAAGHAARSDRQRHRHRHRQASGMADTASATPNVNIVKRMVVDQDRDEAISIAATARRPQPSRLNRSMRTVSGGLPAAVPASARDATDLGSGPVATTMPCARPRTTSVPANAELIRSATAAPSAQTTQRPWPPAATRP